MTTEHASEIRKRLDGDLSLDEFERADRPTETAATDFFQDLFVDVLGFDATPAPQDTTAWRELSVDSWSKPAQANAARIFARSGRFRLVYVELETASRRAERAVIHSLATAPATSDWAESGAFLTVCHGRGSETWHLVTPYESETNDVTTGRPVCRRYTLGAGETHRTVANALAELDATEGRLGDRIDDAFSVEPVTAAFYEDYTDAHEMLAADLREKGLDAATADGYAHTALTRLLFVYFLQQQHWVGERTDLVRWYLQQYRASDDEGVFHETWLSALFFEGLATPAGTALETTLPDTVASAVAALPYLNDGVFERTDADDLDAFVSDSALATVIEDFLERYNFTVTEESPYDVDVAVDPAMLGKLAESLIAGAERDEAGVFYTPRVEVDLLCRMAVYEQLCAGTPGLEEAGEDDVVEFVFAPPRDWNGTDALDADAVAAVLENLRVVDPACGSGAFLVGMKRVLTELYRKLGVTPDADLEERILAENLHGVDVKDWAVRVAEFRFWLSLVESQPDAPGTEPALPNLSFELRTGDSIVQTVDGERVSFEGFHRTAGSDTRRALDELEALQRRYFDGRTDLADAVREQQFEVLATSIDEQLSAVEADVGAAPNGTGSTDGGRRAGSDGAERAENLRELETSIANAGEDCFLWELDFPAVMLDGGFDVVVGNPPYVRGRDIAPQSYARERLDAMPDSRVSDLASTYKTRLREYTDERFDVEPYKTSDLYLYFFFKGFDILAPDGTLSYVTSNSWLNTKYGKRLQEGLLRFTDLEYVLDNRSTRSFAQADINTSITLANRRSTTDLAGECSFVSVGEAYDEFVTAASMGALLSDAESDYDIEYREESFAVSRQDGYREVSIPSESLWSLGGGTLGSERNDDTATTPQGTYGGDRWVRYHRAPDIYFEILERAGGAFDELAAHVDDVKTGAYSGLNDFYYFETERGAEFEARIDEELLVPFIRRPEQVQTPALDTATLETNVFVCPKSKSELERDGHDAALEYIEWGEQQQRDDGTPWPEVPSVSGRDPGWWALPAKDSRPTNLFIGYVVDTRFTATFSDDLVTSDRCFHRVYDDTDRLRNLHVIFASSLGPFLIELTGTSNLGQGALKFETRLLKTLPTPDPDAVTYDAVADPMQALGNRPIGSVFEELGAETPEAVTLEGVADDRRAVDEYVLGDLLGLDDAAHVEIYRQIVEMVGNRIGKARSV